MVVKKSAGKIVGMDLTVAERKAMEMEIQKTIAEFDRKNALEINAMVLWVLHDQFGFGIKRLRQFYKSFDPALERLFERYEMEDSDRVWLCLRELKEYGIDLEKWSEEDARNE